MFDWFLKVVKENYATFTGRASRAEYWYFTLVAFIISFAISAVATLIGGGIGGLLSGLGGLFSLAILVPSIAVGVRRLHDTGKSGWYLLLGLIPVLGTIAVIYFLVQPSDPDTNLYGYNPEMAPFLED